MTLPGVPPAAFTVSGTSVDLFTTSRLSAYIMPFTFAAPRRLNMIGWSNAITFAVSVRAQTIAAPTCVDSRSAPAVAASLIDKRFGLIGLPLLGERRVPARNAPWSRNYAGEARCGIGHGDARPADAAFG
jgi:hypothetical protein